AACRIDQLAQRPGKEDALRDARVASVELVDESVACETRVHTGDAGLRRDRPGRREIADRVTPRIPRCGHPDRPDYVLHGPEDRKKKRGRACVIGTAMWS